MIVGLRRALRSLGRLLVVQRRTPLGRLPAIHARGQIRPFTIAQPTHVRDALRSLRSTLDSRAMGGGIDLINEMKLGSEVAHVVHLANISGLRGITLSSDYLTIGATTTHEEIERSAAVFRAIPDLARITQEIANVRVRAVGTIAGNLMAGHRYYDWLPLLLALGAELSFADRPAPWYPAERLTSASGRWHIPRWLLTKIRIPLTGRPRLRFNRDLKPALSLALCVRDDEGGIVGRVAIGCAYTAPILREIEALAEREAVARRTDSTAEVIATRTAAALPRPHDDGLAEADYRRSMARTLLTRALLETLEA